MSPAVQNQQRRRLVIHIGPPKTGSKTLQSFLSTYAGHPAPINNTETKSRLKGWIYPMFNGHRAGLAYLLHQNDTEQIYNEFQNLPNTSSIVLSSEFLLFYYSGRNGIHRIIRNGTIFESIANWTGLQPEIVVNYRSPRTSHLISLWKQITARSRSNETFPEFMCSRKEKTDLQIRWVLDPLHAVNDLVQKHGFTTYLLDMGGAAKQGIDPSHAFACSILNVNCTEDKKWVNGLEGRMFLENARNGDPNITLAQFQDMEEIIHQRDCSYGNDLYQHPLLRHLYPHNDSWPIDCQLRVQAMPQYRDHPETMIEQLRKVVRCGDPAEPEKEGSKDLVESDEKGEAIGRTVRLSDPVEQEKVNLKDLIASDKKETHVPRAGPSSGPVEQEKEGSGKGLIESDEKEPSGGAL
eukprot:scaffold8959_cov109-Cylindrotheca_fusiformis.AAC.4